MIKYFTIITVALLFTGCLSGKKVLRNPEMFGLMRITDIKDTTAVITTTDTILDIFYYDWSQPDTTMLRLYLECDSAGQVLLKQVQDLTNAKTKERIIYKWKLTDNTLELNSIVAELRRQLNIQKEVNRHRTNVTVTERRVEVPKPYVPDVLYYVCVIIILITNYLTYRITKKMYKK